MDRRWRGAVGVWRHHPWAVVVVGLVVVGCLVAGVVAVVPDRHTVVPGRDSGPSVRVAATPGAVLCELHGCLEGVVDTAAGSLHLVAVDLRPDPLRADLDLVREYDAGARGGLFGPGWRSLLDTRLAADGSTLDGMVSGVALPGTVDGRVVHFGDGATWKLDSDGRVQQATGPSGVLLRVHRDERRITVSGPTAVITLALDGRGRVTSATQERPGSKRVPGQAVSYGYDPLGRLLSVKGWADRNAEYEYGGPGGRLTEATGDGPGVTVTWSGPRVDALTVEPFTAPYRIIYGTGRTSVTAPGATKPTEYAHDDAGRLTKVSTGSVTGLRRVYDTAGRLSEQTDAGGRVRFGWVGTRLASSERLVDHRWVKTTYGWDGLGRLVRVTEDGRGRLLEYDGDAWQPSAAIDETQRRTSFSYHDGVLASATDADGVTTKITEHAGAEGSVVKADTEGSVASVATGSPSAGSSSGGPSLYRTADKSGRVSSVGLTRGVKGEKDAGVGYGYDDFGQVTRVVGRATRTLAYDSVGRVLRDGSGTLNVWDAAGRLTARTCPAPRRAGCSPVSYAYDSADRITRITSPAGTEARSYDAAGRVSEIERGGVRWTVLNRTKAGRPSRLRGPTGVIEVIYDDGGRVKSVKTPTGAITEYQYEGGLLVGQTRGQHEVGVKIGHDALGRINLVKTPVGIYRYTYDSVGRLLKTTGSGRATTFKYNTAGQLVSQERNDEGTRSTYAYDDLGRIEAVTAKKDNKVVADTKVTYKAGRVTKVVTTGEDTSSVAYDPDGQHAAVKSGDDTEDWTWTADGRLASVKRGEDTYDLRYDPSGRLTSVTKRAKDGPEHIATLVWNASGVTGHTDADKPDAFLRWNEFGQPVNVRAAGSKGTVAFDYTGDGALAQVQQREDGKATDQQVKVTWDKGVPTKTTSTSGSVAFDCAKLDCHLTSLSNDKAKVEIDYRDGKLSSAAHDNYRLTFRTDEAGKVTGAERRHGDSNTSGTYKDGKWTGDLAGRLKALLGDAQSLPGISTGPLLPDLPILDAIPSEIRPDGITIDLPDEVVANKLASLTPSVPQPLMDRVGKDQWLNNLLTTVAPVRSPLVQFGPFGASAAPVLQTDQTGDSGTAVGDPLGKNGWKSVDGALENAMQPNPSIISRATTWVLNLLPIVAGLAAGTLFFGPARFLLGGVVGLAAVASCALNIGPCGALTVASLILVSPVLGSLVAAYAVAAFVQGAVEAGIDAVSGLLHGLSLQQVATAAAIALVIGAVVGTVLPGAAGLVCRANRVVCYSATKFPETAAAYANAGGRRSRVLTVDRAGATARRREALADFKVQSGFDRDEFPPAFTRQGGAGALRTYVSPAENRRAGQYFGQSARHLDNGQRFLFLITDLPTQNATLADSYGASAALAATGQSRTGG